jgi:hypothetical protein
VNIGTVILYILLLIGTRKSSQRFTRYLTSSISAEERLSISLKGSEDRHGDIVYINILLLVGTKKQWEITREPENKKKAVQYMSKVIIRITKY